jgi:transcriptional regulator with XRE-family HTH domain
LTSVAAKTGISKSTLSRLESGQRKPSLELLLALAEAYQVPLDELVGAPEVGDPRVRLKPRTRNGRLVFPLTQQTSGLRRPGVRYSVRRTRPAAINQADQAV